LPAFSFDERCAKEKAIKKKTLMHGALPQTPRAFEKARQNFSTWVCANIPLNPNSASFHESIRVRKKHGRAVLFPFRHS
jgi:hypothetical protein